jgi:hypothetical protein
MVKSGIFLSGGALALLLTSAQASAQLAGPAGCELHFWPTEKAQTSNASGVGGAIGGALAGKRMTSEDGLLSDLPPEAQAEALRALDLQALLGTPAPVSVVLQTTPLKTKTATSSRQRLTASAAPCYAELAVKRIGYRSHITAGRDFGAVFILRRYATPSAPARVVQGGADVSVKLYPARTEEERPAANAELQQKFGRTAEKFLTQKGQ